MTKLSPEPLVDVTCSQELTAAKGWLTDGAICIDGAVVEHTIQPPDRMQVPALAEHLIAVSLNAGDRQVIKFAGQEYDDRRPKNCSVILPKETPSEFIWNDEDEAIFFGITHQSLREVAEKTECANANTLELRPLLCVSDEQIARYAHLLHNEIRTDRIGSRLYSESILTAFNIYLLNNYCTFEAKLKKHVCGLAPYKLKEVLEYIDSHLTEGDLSLRSMAEMTDLSRYYFARQFKQSTGYAPHQYVVHQRIEKAKRLLKQRKLSIGQVALACGFSNQSHLSRTFRKATGTTPKRYRDSF